MSAAKLLVFAVDTETTPWLKQPIVCTFCKKVGKSRRKLQYTKLKSFWTLQITLARRFVSNFACVGSYCWYNYALKHVEQKDMFCSYVLYTLIYYGIVIRRRQGLYRLYWKLEKLFRIRVDAWDVKMPSTSVTGTFLLQLYIPFGASPLRQYPPLFRFHDVAYYQRKWMNRWDKVALLERHKSDICLVFKF